jgi:hypothetical protein
MASRNSNMSDDKWLLHCIYLYVPVAPYIWINLSNADREIIYMKSNVFWDVTPCSPVEVHQSLRLKSINLYQTTRRHILEDSKLIVTVVRTSNHTYESLTNLLGEPG